MKLLFAANLKGRPRSYNALISRAEDFAAMFWLGDLIDSALPNTGEQRIRLVQAAGEIQTQGCRVLASGPQADVLDLCHWFRDDGTFVGPGFIVTRHYAPDAGKLMELREAAWKAGALWIVLADHPESVAALTGDRSSAPDVVVTSRRHRDAIESDWCERRGDTWILTPDAPARFRYAEIELDLHQKHLVRTAGKRVERRDARALFRPRLAGAGELLVEAA